MKDVQRDEEQVPPHDSHERLRLQIEIARQTHRGRDRERAQTQYVLHEVGRQIEHIRDIDQGFHRFGLPLPNDGPAGPRTPARKTLGFAVLESQHGVRRIAW
jgi:hypothetical protein